MSFIHLTAKRFENVSADSIYITSLAEGFSKILGPDYLLVVGNMVKGQFKGINTINLHLLSWGTGLVYFLFPYFVYFFWLPYFILFKVQISSKTKFFLSDPHLLWILILWRRILSLDFIIISDWHMLHDDWKDNFIAKNSDVLITTSSRLKQLLIEKTGVREPKVDTVYGGVEEELFNDVDTYSVRRKYGLPEDKKIVAYIGLFKTMGMEKGIDTMISSLVHLNSDVMMLFVGGKKGEIEEYSHLAKVLGVDNRVRFIEKIEERSGVYDIERAVDALVIPYPNKPHFRDYGFPMKVYEYMATKKPIIYSKLELIGEVLGDCGFPFTAGDSEDLAKVVSYVVSNENVSVVTENASLAFEMSKKFTWLEKTQRIIELSNKHE